MLDDTVWYLLVLCDQAAFIFCVDFIPLQKEKKKAIWPCETSYLQA